MKNTSAQYDSAIKICKDIFVKKMHDYGSAWRVLRARSITDQIFIKAQRIRSIEDKGTQKVQEGLKSEYIGIINYAIIGLIQLSMGNDNELELPIEKAVSLYDKYFAEAKSLMENKNHDYDEAWRDMRVSSFTDLICFSFHSSPFRATTSIPMEASLILLFSPQALSPAWGAAFPSAGFSF